MIDEPADDGDDVIELKEAVGLGIAGSLMVSFAVLFSRDVLNAPIPVPWFSILGAISPLVLTLVTWLVARDIPALLYSVFFIVSLFGFILTVIATI